MIVGASLLAQTVDELLAPNSKAPPTYFAQLDRMARENDPRPGRWYEPEDGVVVLIEPDGERTFVVGMSGESTSTIVRVARGIPAGDGRLLDQGVTDALIAIELYAMCPTVGALVRIPASPHYFDVSTPRPKRPDVDPRTIAGRVRQIREETRRLGTVNRGPTLAKGQRGGIHEDHIARMLSFAAWGLRDIGYDRRFAGDPRFAGENDKVKTLLEDRTVGLAAEVSSITAGWARQREIAAAELGDFKICKRCRNHAGAKQTCRACNGVGFEPQPEPTPPERTPQ